MHLPLNCTHTHGEALGKRPDLTFNSLGLHTKHTSVITYVIWFQVPLQQHAGCNLVTFSIMSLTSLADLNSFVLRYCDLKFTLSRSQFILHLSIGCICCHDAVAFSFLWTYSFTVLTLGWTRLEMLPEHEKRPWRNLEFLLLSWLHGT